MLPTDLGQIMIGFYPSNCGIPTLKADVIEDMEESNDYVNVESEKDQTINERNVKTLAVSIIDDMDGRYVQEYLDEGGKYLWFTGIVEKEDQIVVTIESFLFYEFRPEDVRDRVFEVAKMD